jgi:hypothetical protein
MMGEHGNDNRQWIKTSQQCRSLDIKQHGSNVGCLLGFMANHGCFTYAYCPTKIYSDFW